MREEIASGAQSSLLLGRSIANRSHWGSSTSFASRLARIGVDPQLAEIDPPLGFLPLCPLSPRSPSSQHIPPSLRPARPSAIARLELRTSRSRTDPEVDRYQRRPDAPIRDRRATQTHRGRFGVGRRRLGVGGDRLAAHAGAAGRSCRRCRLRCAYAVMPRRSGAETRTRTAGRLQAERSTRTRAPASRRSNWTGRAASTRAHSQSRAGAGALAALGGGGGEGGREGGGEEEGGGE